MDTKSIVVSVLMLLLGVFGGYAFAKGDTPSQQSANQNGAELHGGMHAQMSDMMAGLDGKTGDDFDKAFIAEMIVHHEGAVDMAEAALVNAGHEEIKQMANAIISAQTAEIQQMKEWQDSWYGE